jgi:vacuolar iron transporter family protein
VDDYDYLPDGSWPAEDAPYARYAGRGRPAAGRHRAAGEQEYALSPVNGAPPRQPANGGRAPGYQPPNGRPGPGYLPDSRPRPPYPSNSGPMPAYRAPSGPMPAYRPPNGNGNGRYPSNSGPMPAYRPGTGPMQMTMPVPAELPMPTPIPAYRPPSEPAPAHGRQILGWLPFGNRLVLLPKGLDDDEELREHRDVNGGWLRPAVFGAMDGLVTNSSLIAGVGAGGGAHGAIVLTGIAGLIAGAFSMATGEYISVSSQNELTQSEVELERRQHARDPAGKRRRLAHLFMEKGVSPNLAEAVVHQISADPDRAVATHVREELGIDPDDLPSPRTAAVASLSSFVVGALIPLSPFLAGHPVLKAALVISGVAAFAGGAAVAKLTGRSMVLGGLRQFTAAALATGMALAIGHLIGGHVS